MRGGKRCARGTVAGLFLCFFYCLGADATPPVLRAARAHWRIAIDTRLTIPFTRSGASRCSR